MKKFFAFAAALAVASTPVSVAHAAPAPDYTANVECAAFYGLLAMATEENKEESEGYITNAAGFVVKAAEESGKTQEQVMADLSTQMEADAAVMGDDAALSAYVEDRAGRC
jgi:hypothetical protein